MTIRMKRSLLAVVMIVLMGALASMAGDARRSQDPGVLLRAAIEKEEVDGDLQAAIDQYKEIVAKFAANHAIASKALVRLGGCYEKLGLREATSAYQRVLAEYPDQADAVKIARDKLAVLQGARRPAEPAESGFRIRKIGAIDGGLSPDGKLISCVDWETGDLAVYDVASGKLRRVTNKGSWAVSADFAGESVFSPDGRSIAYNWITFKDTRYDLRIVGTDGTGQRILYGSEDVYYPCPCAWTPDGRYIVSIITDNKQHCRIAMISATDGRARIIKEFDTGAPGKLSLSPDGRWIAFDYKNEPPLKEPAEKRDIYLMAIDGGGGLPMPHPADESLLGWTPDGKSILFLSDRSGTRDAWLQSVQDGKPVGDPALVKRDFGNQRIMPMGFDKNGAFYYGSGSSQRDVYIVSLDPATGGPSGRTEKAALLWEGYNGYPCWSADGNHLAYTSFRSPEGLKPDVLVVKSMVTGEEREISLDLKEFDTVAWFPDGRSLLCRAVVEGHKLGLFRVDLDKGGSESILVLDDMGGLHGMVLSPDGKKVIYDLDDFANQTFRVMSIDLETGQRKELIRSPSQIIAYNLSPDGKWLAFKEGKLGIICLRVIPSEGGEKRTLLRLETGGGINSIAWSPDGRYIYFAKWEKGSSKSEACSLWRIPAEGGDPVKYDLTIDGLNTLSFHPGGKKLAFQSWRVVSEVWVMENFLPAAKEKK